MSPRLADIRVAVVHDWLVDYSGSERVLEQILAVVPHADLFSMVEFLPETLRGFIQNKRVNTTFIQRLPFAKKHYPKYLPLMPAAVEGLDLRKYPLVLSSSSAVAKGVLTEPNQLHICYLQSRNVRYAYDERFLYAPEGWLAPLQEMVLSPIRVWDAVASRRPDLTIANSEFVRRWHRHRHGIETTVIHPPVNTEIFREAFRERKDDYYVVVSRFEPYKQVGLVVEAFNQLGSRLIVVGEGSQEQALRRMAKPNVEFAGLLSPREVARFVAGARAFVYAGREDFGIAPVEAQAAGTPVIAFGQGGVRETVLGGDGNQPTGVFFEEQSVEAIIAAVKRFENEERPFAPAACRTNAERFSVERFRREYTNFVEAAWSAFESSAADQRRTLGQE